MSTTYQQKAEEQLGHIQAKMAEISQELVIYGKDFRIVPLSNEGSIVLAVIESIGVDLIPLDPCEGSVFLDRYQLEQLREAMDIFARSPEIQP